MPKYQYECQKKKCGYRFEKLQVHGEEPVTFCPECEGEVRRVISSAAVVFKGGKPSQETKTVRQGNRDVPVHQTEDGHWEQGGIMEQR